VLISWGHCHTAEHCIPGRPGHWDAFFTQDVFSLRRVYRSIVTSQSGHLYLLQGKVLERDCSIVKRMANE
jgi:hypothetical protein